MTFKSSLYIRYTTEIREGHKIVSSTLTFKVNRQGKVNNFSYFEIIDLHLVTNDTKIKSVSC